MWSGRIVPSNTHHTRGIPMTNYAAMAKRIRACRTEQELKRVSESMDRIYEAGCLTTSQFSRLDGVWVDHAISLGMYA